MDNYWRLHPQNIIVFKDIYDKDKTKDRNESSLLMLAVYYLYDYDSIFFNKPVGDKKKSIMYSLNISNDLIEKAILLKERYYSIFETPVRKMLRVWKEKLDEKIKFIEETEYSESTWEMLDKMQSNFVQAYKQYDQILKEINKEKEQSGQSDSELSLSDKGELF